MILNGEVSLTKAIKDQGITDPHIFTEWLDNEQVYLQRLTEEPICETQEMEYYQKLVNLNASKGQ
jgi:hypothetical protein